jgi:hypothetical protein
MAFLGGLILASAGCGSTHHIVATTTATQAPPPQTSSCVSQQQPGILADFGHRSSLAAANALLTRAEAGGFKGLVVQRRGCNEYAVVFSGLSNMQQAIGLQREARGVGLKITLDCRSEPFRGDIVAVFGRARNRRGAQQIAARAAKVGFRRLDVIQVGCKEWHVLLHGLTSASQGRALAAEARRVGFRVTYEPG